MRALRFRFGEIGAGLKHRHPGAAPGAGVDEIGRETRFHLLLSQSAATYEHEAPTCHAHRFGGADG